ncbi:unnamed protein product, partial [Didymodactylos carnosus]
DDDTYVDIPARQQEIQQQSPLIPLTNNGSDLIDQYSIDSNRYGDFAINDDNEIMPITQFHPSMVNSVEEHLNDILPVENNILSIELINNIDESTTDSYSNRRKPSDTLKSFQVWRKNHQKKNINDQDDEIYVIDVDGVHLRQRPSPPIIEQTDT